MAMRTDQEIMDDIGIGNTVIAEDKTIFPINFNTVLLLEVLLDIREKLDEVKTAIEAI